MYLFHLKSNQLWLECSASGYGATLYQSETRGKRRVLASKADIDALAELEKWLAQTFQTYKIRSGFCQTLSAQITFPVQQDVSSVLTTIPENFSDKDIEDFIYQEHASFFPQTKGELYFDFKITAVESDQKKIEIFALEKTAYQDVLACLNAFKLKPAFLGFDDINFLPWRENHRVSQRNKCFLSSVLSGMFALLLIFSWVSVEGNKVEYLNIKAKNNEQTIANMQGILSETKKAKAEYQQALDALSAEQKNKGSISLLLCLLREVDLNRPVGMRLDGLVYFDNQLSVSGSAKDLLLVQQYEKKLRSVCAVSKTKIQQLKLDEHQALSQYFKIGLLW